MKNLTKLFTAVFVSAFLLTSCFKDDSRKMDDLDYLIMNQKADIEIKGEGKYEKVLINPIVTNDDCVFIVSGTIGYYLDDNLVAIIDYGNGECDNLATKTIDGKTVEFKLDNKDGSLKYNKIIVEPLIKKDDCDFIVSGIIQYTKDEVIVATIDFGNGDCDEWATKTWETGSKVFSLRK